MGSHAGKALMFFHFVNKKFMIVVKLPDGSVDRKQLLILSYNKVFFFFSVRKCVNNRCQQSFLSNLLHGPYLRSDHPCI